MKYKDETAVIVQEIVREKFQDRLTKKVVRVKSMTRNKSGSNYNNSDSNPTPEDKSIKMFESTEFSTKPSSKKKQSFNGVGEMSAVNGHHHYGDQVDQAEKDSKIMAEHQKSLNKLIIQNSPILGKCKIQVETVYIENKKKQRIKSIVNLKQDDMSSVPVAVLKQIETETQQEEEVNEQGPLLTSIGLKVLETDDHHGEVQTEKEKSTLDIELIHDFISSIEDEALEIVNEKNFVESPIVPQETQELEAQVIEELITATKISELCHINKTENGNPVVQNGHGYSNCSGNGEAKTIPINEEFDSTPTQNGDTKPKHLNGDISIETLNVPLPSRINLLFNHITLFTLELVFLIIFIIASLNHGHYYPIAGICAAILSLIFLPIKSIRRLEIQLTKLIQSNFPTPVYIFMSNLLRFKLCNPIIWGITYYKIAKILIPYPNDISAKKNYLRVQELYSEYVRSAGLQLIIKCCLEICMSTWMYKFVVVNGISIYVTLPLMIVSGLLTCRLIWSYFSSRKNVPTQQIKKDS